MVQDGLPNFNMIKTMNQLMGHTLTEWENTRGPKAWRSADS
jgi:ribosomal protein S19